VHAMNEADLAKAVVTGTVPDEMRRFVLDLIKAEEVARAARDAAAASQSTSDPLPTPQVADPEPET